MGCRNIQEQVRKLYCTSIGLENRRHNFWIRIRHSDHSSVCLRKSLKKESLITRISCVYSRRTVPYILGLTSKTSQTHKKRRKILVNKTKNGLYVYLSKLGNAYFQNIIKTNKESCKQNKNGLYITPNCSKSF